MKEALLSTLDIMGWMGIVLGILVIVNTVCGTITNISKGQNFSFKILFKGLLKAIIFYVCSALLAIAFTILPFISTMITNVYGVELIAPDTLITLSSVAVLATVVSAIIAQGKKALEGIKNLLNVKTNTEEITWEVKEDE